MSFLDDEPWWSSGPFPRMSSMKDTQTTEAVRVARDLGAALQKARLDARLSVTAVAKGAGRVRDVVYRLEKGEEVSLSSLFAVLSVLGLQLTLARAAMPTLEQVQARFGHDLDEGE